MLERVIQTRVLRSSNATKLKIKETGMFQDVASKLFNVLPAHLRNCEQFSSFCKLTKKTLFLRAKELCQ